MVYQIAAALRLHSACGGGALVLPCVFVVVKYRRANCADTVKGKRRDLYALFASLFGYGHIVHYRVYDVQS